MLIFVAEIKDVIMIVEMFFIYVMIVLVVVVIKAVSKVGHGSLLASLLKMSRNSIGKIGKRLRNSRDK